MIRRDRWDRPLITPAGGGDPVPYTRVSTLAKSLDSGFALTKWKQRMTALGLAERPDLMALVHAASPEDRTELDAVCEQAMVQAGSNNKANLGTALHKLTEAVDRGMEIQADPSVLADLEAYRATMAQLEVVASEQFVVCDEIAAAGTYDRLVRWAGELMVADLKTGAAEPKYPHGTAIQTATYAHGTPYTFAALGSPLPDTRGVPLHQAGVSQTHALMIHLPQGQARCDLYLVDIEAGWQMARVATGVRRWQKAKPIERLKLPTPPASVDPNQLTLIQGDHQ